MEGNRRIMTEEASKQNEGNIHYIFKGIIHHEYAP